MAILEAEPKGWASWNARITSDGTDLTELKISTWKSRGSFHLDGQDFAIEPEGFWLHNAVLKQGSTVIARAQRPAVMARRWTITSAGHRMELESRSWTGREYVLVLGKQEVGTVKKEGIMGRRITLDFPDEVPAVLQVFLTYIVLCQAKREAAAGAAAGG